MGQRKLRPFGTTKPLKRPRVRRPPSSRCLWAFTLPDSASKPLCFFRREHTEHQRIGLVSLPNRGNSGRGLQMPGVQPGRGTQFRRAAPLPPFLKCFFVLAARIGNRSCAWKTCALFAWSFSTCRSRSARSFWLVLEPPGWADFCLRPRRKVARWSSHWCDEQVFTT